MPSNAIVLSVRPQFAEKIFRGTKTVELRRIGPKHIKKGYLVLVYVSSPIRSLIGAFKVEKIIKKSLKELWDLTQNSAGVTKKEFDDYFLGVDIGIGIFFNEFWPLTEPVKIQDWVEHGINFLPPQSFRYVTKDELASPLIAELVDDFDTLIQSSFLK
jgi:predicted transcriptional regulator